ncbi:MAG: TIGR02281 family clan AA aspartic protease [Magnetococcales bacterium]|nr:TIGR02281 family clan AA aspartic protease [Magnetococcales bacterium]
MLRFVVIFGLLALLAVLLHQRFLGPVDVLGDGGGEGRDTLLQALASALILAWLLASRRVFNLLAEFKRVLIWVGLIGLTAVLFGFRTEFRQTMDRIMAVLVPQVGQVREPGSMSFYRATNGHFYIEARVNGRPVRFLVDTGASDIVLSPRTARQVGLDPARLRFDRVFHTANGMVRGAGVILGSFNLGSLTLTDIPASVNQAAMDTSLLGMGFFNRMLAYKVEGDLLTLYWKASGVQGVEAASHPRATVP